MASSALAVERSGGGGPAETAACPPDVPPKKGCLLFAGPGVPDVAPRPLAWHSERIVSTAFCAQSVFIS